MPFNRRIHSHILAGGFGLRSGCVWGCMLGVQAKRYMLSRRAKMCVCSVYERRCVCPVEGEGVVRCTSEDVYARLRAKVCARCMSEGLFVCLLVFLSRCMEPEGLWQRLVAAPQGRRPFPPGIPISDPRPALIGGIVGISQHLLLPRSAEKALPKQRKEQRKGEKIVHQSGVPPSLLLRPLGSGLDLHLNLRVYLLSRLLLGGRGLVLGNLRSLSSLLPAWAGGGLPPPRKLAGLLLGGAGIGPV